MLHPERVEETHWTGRKFHARLTTRRRLLVFVGRASLPAVPVGVPRRAPYFRETAWDDLLESRPIGLWERPLHFERASPALRAEGQEGGRGGPPHNIEEYRVRDFRGGAHSEGG